MSGSLQSSTPVPGTGSIGQLLGVLSIGAGALLILGGAFGYFRFLKKQPTRVLVVDDDSDIIEVIESMLASTG